MIRKAGVLISSKLEKWMPDSFVFAILLTFIAAGLALGLTPTRPLELLGHWNQGFWSMLEFTMQMALILMLGYIIGISPPVRRLFDLLASKIKRPVAGYLLIVLLAMFLSVFNWGLAPVAAVFAAEVCRRVKGIDFRLACAAVYTAFLPTQGGLSAVAPLMMNTPDNDFMIMGVVDTVIPVSETLGSTLNISLILMSFLIVPLIIVAMAPPQAERRYDAAFLWEKGGAFYGKAKGPEAATTFPLTAGQEKSKAATPSDRLNHSRLLSYAMAIAGTIYLVHHFSRSGLDGLELNSLNLIFLMLGLVLHAQPANFLQAAAEAVKGLSALMLQFPFYAGIMGIVMFSGLSEIITTFFINISTEATFSWFAFISAAVVNLFIPSGGGEWMVIGPSLLAAAEGLGVPLGRVIVAFGYGDTITNLINPFWTLSFLPVMAKVMEVKAREFMGYAMLVALLYFFVVSGAVLFIP